MKDLFAGKKGKIVIIEGAAPLRGQLSESLKALGFSDIVGVPEVKDALGVLESENIKWIITSLFTDKAENGLQLLQLIIDHDILRTTKLSLALEDSETYVLPHAFALGMLSWHKKPFTKDSIEKELSVLLERLQKCDYNSTLSSAMYLRDFLKSTSAYVDLLNLERELIKLYPTNLQLFLNLVEPVVKTSGIDQAKPLLRMVRAVNPAMNPEVDQVMEQLFPGQKLDEEGETSSAGFNFLGLNRIMVVDPDETVHTQLKDLFSSIGIKGVECFTSGVAAIESVKNKPEQDLNFDLVIHEWKLTGLSGPAFLQQLRVYLSATIPIVVLSSLLQKEDLPFVREMGLAATALKPLAKEDFIRTLTFTMQQERLPTDQIVLERKIRALLLQKRFAEAASLKEKYVAIPNITEGSKALIEAEFAFSMKDMNAARTKAVEAIKHTGDSIFSLNLLGKILLRLKETNLALKCFEKAQAIAPLNIDRICSIAEIQAEIGEFSDAKNSLDKAKALDPSGDRVKEATATVALQSGDIKTARKILNEIPAIEHVVAVMNNTAVALINALRYDDGIQKYKTTLEVVPDNLNDIRGIILYNLSLAFARDGRLDDAADTLDLALEENYGKINPKATALKKKVNMVLKMGGNLLLSSAAEEKASSTGSAEGNLAENEIVDGEEAPAMKEVASLLAVQRGEIGCYLVYHPSKADERLIPFLAKAPRFVSRHAIEREESYGMDKIASRRKSH